MKDKRTFSKLHFHVLYGAGFGLFGIVQLNFAFPLGDGTIIDFRQVSILASVYLGGPVSGMITTSVIALYRLFFLGAINQAAILGVVNIGITFLVGVFAFSRTLPNMYRWLIAACGMVILSTCILLPLIGWANIGTIVLFDLICFMACLFNYLLINHLEKAHEALEIFKEAAERDFLTGLHNPRSFNLVFKKTAEMSALNQEPFTLLLIDIDHFKYVNDTYGHAAGDVVLSRLADVLQAGIRIRDYCARKGGEEFAVLLLRCTADKGLAVAEKLRAAVQDSTFVLPDQSTIQITISVGVSSFPEHPPAELLEKADEALYEAKGKGRNQVCYARQQLT
ncbi:diguanylate cyclase [Paenibacillus sp. MMS20-IR301]|uniref:GGDEF domain-containing protein n=1 Tax=Paenibacillus sp. MMS20-IR301 TaxID=2895946 RepID=UPI0028E89209|nr:diguanylate cyclase [Paenibacillus sp. MMS20-IR301]WNS46075.1 diguanylate cyclase [Paenibacillus sp. MMS20-IR301]